MASAIFAMEPVFPRQNEMENICEIQGLTKRYGSFTAVNGLSFVVRRGEIFGLLGPNGAGKTTTINMISGLLKQDSGSIWIHSSLNLALPRHAVGLCPQNIMIWDTLTCYEQLVFMAQMYDVPSKQARERAMFLLSVMGLLEKKNRQAKTLSGGMKRRMNIILALMHSPELVILDEPQAGLDPQSRVLVRDFIRSLREKATVILTTHDMEEADKLSDRVAIMDHGRLLVLGTPESLKQASDAKELVSVVLTEQDMIRCDEFITLLLHKNLKSTHRGGVITIQAMDAVDSVHVVIDTAKTGGFTLGDIAIRRPSLEDVFIGLTGRGLRE